MKFGIKYCGGCNPKFDRSFEVKKLTKEYPGISFEYTQPDETYDYGLLICGCDASCVRDFKMNTRYENILICKQADFEKVRRIAEECLNKESRSDE